MFSIYILQHSLPKMILFILTFWSFELPLLKQDRVFYSWNLLASFNTLFLLATFIYRSFEKADVEENKRFFYQTHRISSIWLFNVKELNKGTKKQRNIGSPRLFSCFSTPVNTWAILATENDESRYSEINNDILSYTAKKILGISLVFLFFKSEYWRLSRKESVNMTRPKEW